MATARATEGARPMSASAKAKGSALERDALNEGRARGHQIERLRATGVNDEGDLALFAGPQIDPVHFRVIPAVLHKRRMKGIADAYLTLRYGDYLDVNHLFTERVVTVLEAKNRARLELAQWMDEATVEADNWVKHRGVILP